MILDRAITADDVIKAILTYLNTDADTPQERSIALTPDWGGDTLTIELSDRGHTHCGYPDDPDEMTYRALLSGLYNAITGGPGLSFVR